MCDLYYHRPPEKRPKLPAEQLRRMDAKETCTCGKAK